MFLINYLKNTVKAKKFGAIIYLIVCAAINVTLFWLIYEKLFRQPHGILIGICLYVAATFILSSPLANVIKGKIFDKDFIMDKYACPKTRQLFEEVKNDYVSAGKDNVKNVKLTVYDEKFSKEINNIEFYGNSEIFVNALSDSLPQETNVGRLAMGIEMLLHGYGEPAAVVHAANAFYILVINLLCLIQHFCVKLYGLIGLGKLQNLIDYEIESLKNILYYPVKWGTKICGFKLNDSIINEILESPYCNEIQVYLSTLE